MKLNCGWCLRCVLKLGTLPKKTCTLRWIRRFVCKEQRVPIQQLCTLTPVHFVTIEWLLLRRAHRIASRLWKVERSVSPHRFLPSHSVRLLSFLCWIRTVEQPRAFKYCFSYCLAWRWWLPTLRRRASVPILIWVKFGWQDHTMRQAISLFTAMKPHFIRITSMQG